MPKSVETFRGVAYPWLCDAMGHMNTQFYSTLYDGAAFHFLAMIAPSAELAPRRLGWADVRQTTEYKQEVRGGSLLVITTQLLKLGTSSTTYLHEMRNAETGELHSTSELVTVLFDLDVRRAAPLDARARARATALLEIMATRIEGRCFWLREAILSGEEDEPPLEGEARADIAIVGGGYAGLWTALELKRREPSLEVTIVEADICGGGASGRNSGMVLPQWAKFAALQQLCGTEGALFIARASERVLDEIEAFSAEHGIQSEFRRDGWLWGASCPRQKDSWAGVVAALEAVDERPFRPVSRDEIASLIGSDRFGAGVLTEAAATLHPGKWVRGLRRAALRAGVRIHENAPMVRLERGRPPRIHTARGRLIAERVVLAMNGWSTSIPELRPGILVIASDDAITAPVPELLDRAGYRPAPLVSDSQTFVTGFRSTVDGRINAGVTGGVIGFGGLRGARFEGRSRRDADIRACLKRGHPALAEPPFIDSWYGPIDRTRTGLPLFGRLPGCPDVLYGYGFSGNGVATTPLAGRILASLVLGVRDEWSECGLVRPVEAWMPPEPIKYVGALMVRHAVRRKDALAYINREPGPLLRRLAALAPGGIVTTRLDRR